MDLIEVSPNANPPVVKIGDYGKYKYQQTKKAAKNKKTSNTLKQIRFSLRIGEHDLEIKLKKVKKFLSEGNVVRVSIFFRGREMAHKELGYQMIEKVTGLLSEDGSPDSNPVFTGRYLSVNIKPKKNKGVVNNAKA